MAIDRRLYVVVPLGLFVVLGAVLYSNIGESRQFRIVPPPKPAVGADVEKGIKAVSSTVVTSLTTLTTQAELERPRYTGADNLNRHWEVTGDRARQLGTATSGTFVLEEPRAIWEDPSQSTPFALAATRGTFLPASNTMVLEGEVSVAGMDMALKSPKMQVDMVSRTLVTFPGARVEAEGELPSGRVTLSGDTLQVDGIERTLHMQGAVRATFTPKGKE